MHRVEHCVKQLSDEQLWHRATPSLNSIANLLLHLTGNVRQWLITGILQQEDHRSRPEEFAASDGQPTSELMSQLRKTVKEADEVIANLTEEQLTEARRIQGFEVTVFGAMYDSISHFAGHAQEIIYMTRSLLGDDYEFIWKPSTPEEGA